MGGKTSSRALASFGSGDRGRSQAMRRAPWRQCCCQLLMQATQVDPVALEAVDGLDQVAHRSLVSVDACHDQGDRRGTAGVFGLDAVGAGQSQLLGLTVEVQVQGAHAGVADLNGHQASSRLTNGGSGRVLTLTMDETTVLHQSWG